MPFKKPLTTDELRELWLRNQTADMRTVLWEVKRLRSLVIRANQMQQVVVPTSQAGGWILESFREALDGEPCIEERLPMPEAPPSDREIKRLARKKRNA